MPKSSFFKLDHIAIGVILGVVIPLAIMQLRLQYFSNLSLVYIIKNPFFSEIVDILKGSVFANLGLFFIFYWLKKDQSARGVILATLLYGAFYLWYIIFI
ncbi:MAG: hypothetical protein J5I47_08690 [Vicingus serpentipes]|nr:hypothetical protein [Vicingus serpentipes]